MALSALFALALLSATSTGAFSFLNDQEALLAVELAESDYVDMCADHANATWAWLINPTRRNFKVKLQADEDLAQAQRSNSDSLREFSEPASLQDAGLRERVVLASSPGAATLPLPDYRQVIQFAARSLNATRSQTVPCYNTSSPSCLWDWHKSGRVLSGSHDPYRSHHAWLRWHRLFSPQAAAFGTQQELLQRAAVLNGADDIWEYWELLTDFPESGRNATSLWAGELEQLYGDLRRFVLGRLRFQYGRDVVGDDDDDLLPLHLLGSFVGDDWLRIADLVTPPLDDAYKNLSSSLRKKSWKGQHLYGVAAGVGSKMGLPSLKKTPFWENAHFNGTCPAAVVPWCTENYVRIQTCDEVDVHTYLDAHRVTMHALFHQLSVHNGRFILRQLNRHSALLEAVKGLGELLAMSHQQLTRLGLLSEAAADSTDGAVVDRQLRLLVALHTLPKLAHALAADVWRAEGVNSTWNAVSSTIKGVRPPRDVTESWEYVQDSKIALNQPYLGTAAGIILQFQLFEKLLNDNIHDPQNPVDVIKKDGLLRKLMVAGQSAPWLDVVNQILGITELDVKPLLRYFEPIRTLLLSDVAPDTPQVAKFERHALPPDVSEEKPTEPTTVTETGSSSTPQTVSSRSQEAEGTSKPEGDNSQSGPLPGPEPKADSARSSQAILIGSLSLIGIGLVTGVILAGRHFYRKKKQRERRNRRPT